jgi:uncharacterized protein (DUF2235 family)
MPKNIVVCCDGTANQVVSGDNTNVVRLCAAAIKDPAQIIYYGPGLGTMEAEGAITWWQRVWTKLAGLASGYAIARDIRNAYSFIMVHYEPGDRLFLFGFSRGAYTARAVASLLRMYGLLRIGNESLVPYIVRELLHVDSLFLRLVDRLTFGVWKLNAKLVGSKFDKATEVRTYFATRSCKPHFVGVWDTVSSVGLLSPTRIPYTANNEDIVVGRHALALDERRVFFNRNLWQRNPLAVPTGPHDIKEVWFAGVHSDVGGGYPEEQGGLSKIALQWMMREAIAHGLLVDQTVLDRLLSGPPAGKSKPDPDAKMHNSMSGFWPLIEFVPVPRGIHSAFRINFFRRRQVPDGALIHVSVKSRTNYARPLPPNHRVEN